MKNWHDALLRELLFPEKDLVGFYDGGLRWGWFDGVFYDVEVGEDSILLNKKKVISFNDIESAYLVSNFQLGGQVKYLLRTTGGRYLIRSYDPYPQLEDAFRKHLDTFQDYEFDMDFTKVIRWSRRGHQYIPVYFFDNPKLHSLMLSNAPKPLELLVICILAVFAIAALGVLFLIFFK